MPEHDVREDKKGSAMKRMSLHQTGQPTIASAASYGTEINQTESASFAGQKSAADVGSNIAVGQAYLGAG